ncbi:MAG: CPBP family intramembrane metalloprotease [Oscillospiraceae bacterium]|nr:CPBP family intramembrane metalloprotease [Oscillospiraceae bacterium]
MQKRAPKKTLILYCLCFYALWICFEFLLKPHIASAVIKTAVIKNAVWTLPACLLIHRYSNSVAITLREMFTRRVNWLRYLPVFALFAAYLFAGNMLLNGKIALSGAFSFDDAVSVLFVGLTEELVFRGWLLNAAAPGKNKRAAIAVNALMFLLIHIPSWIHRGELITNLQSFGFVSILVLSVVFSVTFLKSRSILIPAALHMFWDLIMLLFYE